MTEADSAAQFKTLVYEIGDLLKSRGYSRRGVTFRRLNQRNYELVGFQRSVINTVDRLKFTINLGIVSSHIADDEQVDPARVGISDAHFRTRIGTILPTKGDKWWELQPKSDLDKVADELLKILEEEALPYLHKIASDDALADLWAGKTAPGLTDAQRVRYLQIIRADKPTPKAAQ